MTRSDRTIHKARMRQARRKDRRRRLLRAKRAEDIPWNTMLAVLAVTAVIVATVVVAAGGSHGRTSLSASKLKSRMDHEVSSLLSGIPQRGNTLGQTTAPVTLQIFGDLECYTARKEIVELLPGIIQDFVRSKILKIEYRSLKTDTHNPEVFVIQQAAALAAGAQNMMWNFIETFYHEQGREHSGYVTEKYLDGIARQIPDLDLVRWNSDRNAQLVRKVVADNNAARTLGLYVTPSFLIGRTGGRFGKLFGRNSAIFPGEKHPVSVVDRQDINEAIERLP